MSTFCTLIRNESSEQPQMSHLKQQQDELFHTDDSLKGVKDWEKILFGKALVMTSKTSQSECWVIGDQRLEHCSYSVKAFAYKRNMLDYQSISCSVTRKDYFEEPLSIHQLSFQPPF